MRVMRSIVHSRAMQDVQHEDHGDRGSFYIEKDGARAGLMTYTHTGDHHITIDHTEVGDALRGTGAGKKMVQAAVAWARAEHLTITPRCPFARATFEKDPSLQDVLAP
jgi:predicted GNAT family acetyltransferase